MPRDGALAIGDLIGRLDYLALVCERCGRRGRYSVARLVKLYGRDANLADWRGRMTADCPHRGNHSDPCGAACPDLPKVF